MVSSKDAVEEVRKFLASKNAYITPSGRLKYGVNNPVVELVLHNFTSGLEGI